MSTLRYDPMHERAQFVLGLPGYAGLLERVQEFVAVEGDAAALPPDLLAMLDPARLLGLIEFMRSGKCCPRGSSSWLDGTDGAERGPVLFV
jgi:hypothetical protein